MWLINRGCKFYIKYDMNVNDVNLIIIETWICKYKYIAHDM